MNPNESLVNGGNSCYSNACMVVLRYLKPFTNSIVKNMHKEDSTVKLIEALLYTDVKQTDIAAYNRFIQKRYGFGQEDVFDCMQYIIDNLPPTFSTLFEIKKEKSVSCSVCPYKNTMEDRCAFIPITSMEDISKYHKPTETHVDIHCDDCRQNTKATITEHVSDLPPVLTFVVDRYTNAFHKNTTHIHPPVKIMHGKHMYRLNSCVCHVSRHNTAGHYVVFVWHENGKITYHNDTFLKEVDANSFEQIGSKYVSLVFYTLFT